MQGISKLLLRLSNLTYCNLFCLCFLFCPYHVCYMLYMSVLKTMYYVHVKNKIGSVLFCVGPFYFIFQVYSLSQCFTYSRVAALV